MCSQKMTPYLLAVAHCQMSFQRRISKFAKWDCIRVSEALRGAARTPLKYFHHTVNSPEARNSGGTLAPFTRTNTQKSYSWDKIHSHTRAQKRDFEMYGHSETDDGECRCGVFLLQSPHAYDKTKKKWTKLGPCWYFMVNLNKPQYLMMG